MKLNSWMAQIDGKSELFRLNIVGTHDCVTQYVQLSHFSKCQDRSISEQLDIGVRALDIRVGSRDGRLKMFHGIAKAFNTGNHLSPQMDMSDVLMQCYAFLERNPSETIIFQFKNDNGREMEHCFNIMYNKYILPNSDRWFLENRNPLLDEVRGRIVLVRRCRKYDDREYTLGTGIDFSEWVEQDTPSPEPLSLSTGGDSPMSFIIQDRYKYKPLPKWRECVLEFLEKIEQYGDNIVINYTSTAGGLKGPYGNAKYINSRFMEYPLRDNVYYGIIYTDFPDEKLVAKVVETNFRK